PDPHPGEPNHRTGAAGGPDRGRESGARAQRAATGPGPRAGSGRPRAARPAGRGDEHPGGHGPPANAAGADRAAGRRHRPGRARHLTVPGREPDHAGPPPPDRSPRSRRPLTRPPEPRSQTARVWLWSRCGPSGDHNHTFERPLLSWRGPPTGTAMLIRGTHPLTPSREAEKEASAGEFWRPTHGRPQWRRHPPGSDPDHTRDPRT